VPEAWQLCEKFIELKTNSKFEESLMSNKAHIYTEKAPAAIGPYSQAVKVNNTIYLSGQIPLDPETMELIDGDIQQQARQVFANLDAVCKAAGSDLSGIVKLNIFLTDLSNFAAVNEVMAELYDEPYPARAAIGVKALP
jgi:reactive intermediate/imine deaminase